MNCTDKDNLDFMKELSKESDEIDNVCLISKEKLENNSITLPCSHSFNYLPLYKEICYQKPLVQSLCQVSP